MESIMFFFFKNKPVENIPKTERELFKEKQLIEENRQKLIDRRKKLKFEEAMQRIREQRKNQQ